jgi:hypothetical protein
MYAADTKVPVSQTRAEIERLLDKHKASQYGTAIDFDLCVARVQFKLQQRTVRFTVQLPDKKKLGEGERFEKAHRQRWRALLLVLKAKLESLENGIETFEEVFLAQIVLPNDRTVADFVVPQVKRMYETGRMLELPASAGPDGGGKK